MIDINYLTLYGALIKILIGKIPWSVTGGYYKTFEILCFKKTYDIVIDVNEVIIYRSIYSHCPNIYIDIYFTLKSSIYSSSNLIQKGQKIA